MGVEQRAKTVDEDHGTEAGCVTGTGAALPQYPLDSGQEDVQGDVLLCRVALKVIAQALGHGEHPLPHRQMRDDVVGQMRTL